MIKFENSRVFDVRGIDFVIDHVAQNSDSSTAVIVKILGELCMMLTDDQQKGLVASLDGYVKKYNWNMPYEWTPVEVDDVF